MRARSATDGSAQRLGRRVAVEKVEHGRSRYATLETRPRPRPTAIAPGLDPGTTPPTVRQATANVAIR